MLRESGDFSDLELDLDEGGDNDASSEDEFDGIDSADEGEEVGKSSRDAELSSEDDEDSGDGGSDMLDIGEEEEDLDMSEVDSEEDDDSDDSQDDSRDFESEFEGSELSFHEGDEEDESGAMTMTFGAEEPSAPEDSEPAVAQAATTNGRYVPPHLRNRETAAAPKIDAAKPSDSLEAPPDDPRLRRLLNGHLNKLSPQNIATINDSLLSLYASHPRAIVSSTLTHLLLGIVSDRDNLGDQLMITYACLVGALFRTIGIEFPAGVLTQAITMLDKSLAKADAATAEQVKEEEGGFEGKPGSKQAQNLIAFLSELYNFGVIACGVVYDLVRLFIERGQKGLGELEVELLSKIVKRGSNIQRLGRVRQS